MATWQQISDSVRFRLGNRTDLSSGVGLTNLEDWINAAIREIAHMHRFPQQETEATVTTNSVDRFVPLPADTYAILTVRDLTNNRPLTPLEGDWHEYERRDTSVPGRPTKWLRFGNNLYFYLPPDAAYNMRLGIWKEPPAISSAAPVDEPALPEVWHDGVKILATRNGWRALGDDRRAELIETGEWARFATLVKTPHGAERNNPQRRGLRVRHYINQQHKGA